MKTGMEMKIRALKILAFCVMAALAAPAFAQESEPGYESSEEFENSKEEFGQEQEKEKPAVSFRLWGEELRSELAARNWGGWGGPLVAYLNLDLGALDPMTDDRGVPRFEENLFMVGGLGGAAYRPPDQKGWWYFGGMGFGMNQDESDKVAGQDRRAEMSLGGGGVFLEYHYPFGARVEGALGCLLGAGSLTLKAEGDDIGPVDDDEWSENESFALYYPYGGVSVGVTKWMKLEAMAGYMFMQADLSGADYMADTGLDLTDGDVLGGPQYMVRIIFGFGP